MSVLTERLTQAAETLEAHRERQDADAVRAAIAYISEGRSIKDKLAWCVEDLTKQLKARERELSKVLQQQAEADNERDAVEEGLRAYAEELRENLEILHDSMCIAGGLTHTQGDGYAQSPRCEIVMKLLAKNPVTTGGPKAAEANTAPPCESHETGKESGLQKYERTLAERLRPQSGGKP